MRFTKMTPVAALLTGATVWGLIWYPYRALQYAGIGPELAATLTYAGALAIAAILFRGDVLKLRLSRPIVAIAVTAGWTNIGFVIAVVHGDVMRVVLLFYLAPVWTVLLSRLLLDERLTAAGYGLMVIAFAGAMVMLWEPRIGWPLPRSAAEWIGASAGFAFAFSNVLARRAHQVSIASKAVAVLGGCLIVGAASVLVSGPTGDVASPGFIAIALCLLLSVVLVSVNIAVQFGLSEVSANRASVIYLFELLVTAVAAWLLVGEVLTLREWCGGAMIVAAGLLSHRLTGPSEPTGDAAGS